MKVFILTEGGKNIGFGHITRCLSLSQAFEEKEIIPELILNSDDNIEYLLKGIKYQKLNWIKKRDKLFELIKGTDIAIIDSYLADSSFYVQISNLVKIPVYIDDNKRLDYPDGIVVNGNIHVEKLNYPKKDGITYLLGTKYTPLRKEFWEVPQKKIKEKVESIMIAFGGDDAKNMTPKILVFLNDKYPNLIKNVIIGRSFQNIDEIKKYMNKNTNLIYYPDAEKMKEIMLESDIAISAGGQTLYELARIGVPTIGICIAENQLGSIWEWEKIGFLGNAGWYNEDNIIARVDRLLKHLENIKLRETKYKIGKKFVDGKGSLKIINRIIIN